MNIKEITVGMSASYQQTITEYDIRCYSGISGDKNPLHVSTHYAKSTIFKDIICHGMLPAGFFSAIFGNQLPGPGCAYVKQTLEFRKPIYVGDTVTAIVEVTRVFLSKRLVEFKTICTVKDQEVIVGKAVIYVPG